MRATRGGVWLKLRDAGAPRASPSSRRPGGRRCQNTLPASRANRASALGWDSRPVHQLLPAAQGLCRTAFSPRLAGSPRGPAGCVTTNRACFVLRSKRPECAAHAAPLVLFRDRREPRITNRRARRWNHPRSTSLSSCRSLAAQSGPDDLQHRRPGLFVK